MRFSRRNFHQKRWLPFALLITSLGLIVAGVPAGSWVNARPQAWFQAVTERMTYNAGEEVWLRIVSPSPPAVPALDSFRFTIRYVGDDKPVAEGLVLGHKTRLDSPAPAPSYHPLWTVPLDARTGRYEIDMRVRDPKALPDAQDFPRIGSFVVHRQQVRIMSIDVFESYYTSGDVMPCEVKLENASDQALHGLRIEFSERYWPWIVQQTQKVGADIETLQDDFTLPPHTRTSVSSSNCAVVKGGNQPAIKQYAAVVWNRDRQNVYAIGFSPLVFINPPGVDAPHPYPSQFLYPSVDGVNTSSYRKFHPERFGAGAIQFATDHTMFPSGAEGTVKFSLANPTDTPWHQVSVRARLLAPGDKELASQVVAERLDLDPHHAPLEKDVRFALPQEGSGLYRARVEITDASGQALSANTLELGVNPLPQSVLVFCAHEDDDGTQMGFIRALVENQIPLHIVYFTSGDAGSCDRYFQHSCGPAEALNFGGIRMQEARAALGHLGVPRENILFLGLPDGGTGKIWYEHPRTADPYLAVLLASDHAPYDGLFRPNLPYARDAVVDTAGEIIKRFQPQVIFTVHPGAVGHIDHIVNNYFVVKALEQLLREGNVSPDLEVRVDSAFDPLNQPPTPYHYEGHTFYVSGEVMARAQEAGWYYQSQSGNRAEANLRTWEQLPRSEGYRKVLDWKEHEGWNEKE